MNLPDCQRLKRCIPVAAVLMSLLLTAPATAKDPVDDCLRKMSVRISRIMEINKEEQIFIRSVTGSGRDEVIRRRLEAQLEQVKLKLGNGWSIATECQVELDGNDVVVQMKLQLRDRRGRAEGTLTGFVQISRQEWFGLK